MCVTFRDFNLLHWSFQKRFPLFIWLMFAIFSVSNFHLAEVISYLGSLVQFSLAVGRAGRCRQTSLCVGSIPRVPATLGLPRTGVSVLSPSTLLRLPAAYMEQALCWVRFQFSGPPQKRGFCCACVLCLPQPQRLRQPGAWTPSPRVWRALSLRGPSACCG